MLAIDKEEILRVNCPGFGVESYFSEGCAKPLPEYNVIVVNPVSVLHLFDKDPELLEQISIAQSDGLTAFPAKSDKVIESVLPDLQNRTQELAQFLQRGGLLIYFLAPPFLVQGPQVTVDNYAWLDALAPDNSTDKNRRNMSSAARGKNIETTTVGQSSPFAAYFKQAGLEWTTLVRSEKLASGYTILATAGPNKCIAAQLEAGDNGGLVLFLPAPYQREYDDRLMQCINLWYSTQTRLTPLSKSELTPNKPLEDDGWTTSSTPISVPEQNKQESPASEFKNLEPVTSELESEKKSDWEFQEPNWDKMEFGHSEPEPATEESKPSETVLEGQAAKAEEPGEPGSAPESVVPESVVPEPAQAPESVIGMPEPASLETISSFVEEVVDMKHEAPKAEESQPSQTEPEPSKNDDDGAPQIVPKAKDLMERMEEISKPAPPDWCLQYSFADLDNMRDEMRDLNEQVRLTQMKVIEVEKRITTMEWLKNALLSLEGQELHNACSKVLEQLGWHVSPQAPIDGELLLQDSDITVGIVKVVRTTSQAKRADLAQLAESIITYWGEHETEPKGVLVASTWVNRPPSERTEPDYTDALAEFAQKKNLCLMTTFQLLSIYRDVESGQASAKELRDNILSTSGRLSGFTLEPRMAGAGR